MRPVDADVFEALMRDNFASEVLIVRDHENASRLHWRRGITGNFVAYTEDNKVVIQGGVAGSGMLASLLTNMGTYNLKSYSAEQELTLERV